ncbi:MAG TPA: DNA polymerase III subunit alpha, partial [Janthinobacterium sp.]|nr:DNA polymerase III subunit alpha [Janthinobacterium sp.]
MEMVSQQGAAAAAAPREPAFVHLRVHSEYSIVDGLVRIDDVVEAAAQDKQAALAMTDLSNLFGMVKFYKAARGKGVKPVVGCDVWISNDDNRDKPSRLLLLAKNRIGYLQLCELLSKAWLENQHKGRAEIRAEWLQALAGTEAPLLPGVSPANGLIVLSGAHFGDVGIAIENGNLALAERNAQRWAALFPGHFYIEIQRGGQPNQERQVRQSV